MWRSSAARTRAEPVAPPPSEITGPGGVASSSHTTCSSSSRKALSPCDGEVVLDPLPEPLLDDRVGVDGAAAERRRGRTGRGRLAGSHEADEDERALAYGRRRFHPIRSS